ncbi:MAG: 23S rRNA (adenine(2503)-C(2))-methyltransferase RlmN [Candidatus Falkowbacteria bacterium]|nr:MAG: 23S rRNA (adenine(2503)-C(2))-methyltransferase RlmN [Candidatus Falkowbacteria bacterium]
MKIKNLSKVLEGQPKYRYAQINKFLFQDYISDWDEASSLPKKLREELSAACPLEIKAEVFANESRQKTQRALVYLEDGESVETVLIRQKVDKNKDADYEPGEADKRGYRNTVCVSSQIGCPLGCTFCATGQLGFLRNLSSAEIVEQVVFWQRLLKAENSQEKVDNIVFMGMGEPFLNYPEFIKAVKFINNPETLNIGARRMSVSTAGLTEGIKKLAGEKLQINLAISLHAANDSLRQKLMPIAKKYALADIFKTVDDYIKKTGRRVMFEYLMIKGINDSSQDAENLARLMRKPLYLLNLIPYNDTGRFQTSSRETINDFKNILEKAGVSVTVRLSFGSDIAAACGQLHKNNSAAKSRR